MALMLSNVLTVSDVVRACAGFFSAIMVMCMRTLMTHLHSKVSDMLVLWFYSGGISAIIALVYIGAKLAGGNAKSSAGVFALMDFITCFAIPLIIVNMYVQETNAAAWENIGAAACVYMMFAYVANTLRIRYI